jgi:hypothetical protein
MFRIPRILKKAVRAPKTKKGKHSKLSLGVVAVLTAAGLGSYMVSSGVSSHDPASAQVKPPTVVTVTDGPTTTLTSSCGLTTKIPDYASWQGFAAASKTAEQDCTTIPALDIPNVVSTSPVVAPPAVTAPADSYVHNLYPTTPTTATTTTPVTKNATTVTIIPDCPKGQLPLEIPTTSEWQCVADPTVVVAPVVVAPAPVTPVVVPVTTNPVVPPVTVAPVVIAPTPINPELDPFVFKLKMQASYFSWVSDPKMLLDYGKGLCAGGTTNPFALENPLVVPVPVGDGIHVLTPGDVLYAIATAYAYGCPQAPLHNPAPYVPTLLEIANHMPPLVGSTPVNVVAPVTNTPTNVAPVVPVTPVNPSNDVVLTA